MTSSKIYATQYVEPGLQEAASKTYTPTGAVVQLINGNPNIVSEARSKCFADAAAYYKKRSRTSEAVNEMEREYSAKVANAQLYGMAEDDLIEFKEKQEILLEALKHSKIVLDSAVFLFFFKDEQK